MRGYHAHVDGHKPIYIQTALSGLGLKNKKARGVGSGKWESQEKMCRSEHQRRI